MCALASGGSHLSSGPVIWGVLCRSPQEWFEGGKKHWVNSLLLTWRGQDSWSSYSKSMRPVTKLWDSWMISLDPKLLCLRGNVYLQVPRNLPGYRMLVSGREGAGEWQHPEVGPGRGDGHNTQDQHLSFSSQRNISSAKLSTACMVWKWGKRGWNWDDSGGK